MPPVGFEHTIPAGERPQTYTLDRAATGTGVRIYDTKSWEPLTSLTNSSLGCKRKDKLCQSMCDWKPVIFVDILVGYRTTRLLKGL